MEIKHKHPHQPVLLEQVLELLSPQHGDRYLDLTAGYGGHASAVLGSTTIQLCVLVDRDQAAIDYLTNRFNEHTVQIKHADMITALTELRQNDHMFDLVLIDAGVSSLQLDYPERGFSFSGNGPLDMRMDQSQELSASTIINEWSEAEIARVIHEYGEEPLAKRIARAILTARPITSTHELANVVATAKRRRRGRIHPATLTFQAVRIAVNDELRQLQRALGLIDDVLAPGGRMAVISFHSLEDRIVKHHINERSNGFEATYRSLTKKPRTASSNDTNPRARSAKLRVAVKLKQTQKGETNAD